MSSKSHWNTIYHNKSPEQLSWTQDVPSASLEFVEYLKLPTDAKVIDIGGGESHLVDILLGRGFTNITVLDISEEALRHAQRRLGDKASRVRWISSDVTDFVPDTSYDLWHDRATFHFLTRAPQVHEYVSIARDAVAPGGFAVLGTFSPEGPKSCSGLPVRQYSEETLAHELEDGFQKLKCVREDHHTPFHTVQNFLFCAFRRS